MRVYSSRGVSEELSVCLSPLLLFSRLITLPLCGIIVLPFLISNCGTLSLFSRGENVECGIYLTMYWISNDGRFLVIIHTMKVMTTVFIIYIFDYVDDLVCLLAPFSCLVCVPSP